MLLLFADFGDLILAWRLPIECVVAEMSERMSSRGCPLADARAAFTVKITIEIYPGFEWHTLSPQWYNVLSWRLTWWRFNYGEVFT